MKKSILIGFFSLLLIACSSNNQRPNKQSFRNDRKEIVTDTSSVYVYYFHGKQRCKTCITVGDLTAETINEFYADNLNVRFIDIDTSEKKYETLIEKYEVAWNALIIAKGDNYTDITEKAFSNAFNNPESLINLIKSEVYRAL